MLEDKRLQIKLINDNLINYYKLFGLRKEAIPVEHHILNTGYNNPLLNLIFLPFIVSDEDINNMEYAFRQQNLPFIWWVEEQFIGHSLDAHFQKNNFKFFGDVLGMILNLNKGHSVSTVEHSDLLIKQIFTKAEFNTWIDVLPTNFSLTKEMQELRRTKLLPYLLNSQDHAFFGIYIDNQLVGTASIFIHNNVAGFYNGSTLKNFRKKGIVSALYKVMINHLGRLNFDKIVIQTSPAATSLVKKLGFEEVINYKIYMHD